MHDIEPYYKWRDSYVASEDRHSPFYGREYSEFTFTNKIYNYFIHPQWDDFGSSTLYLKILFVDYDKQFAIIELIGEWNDCIDNDIMYLKREVIDKLQKQNIKYFILLCDNVLNFHASDDSYYEEWYEDVCEYSGWMVFVNLFDHVLQEMQSIGIQYYAHIGPAFNGYAWHGKKPSHLFKDIAGRINSGVKQLRY